MNLLSTDNKRRQIGAWLRDGKKNFIEKIVERRVGGSPNGVSTLISSTCFEEYFPLDVQLKMAKMERDEQWNQLRDFVLAQGNDIATLEYLKWEVCRTISFEIE